MDARWIDAAGLDGWMDAGLNGWMDAWRDASLSVRILTVFRHCVRAFLLCSSTFCVHFYYVPALSSVRISTVFQHCVPGIQQE